MFSDWANKSIFCSRHAYDAIKNSDAGTLLSISRAENYLQVGVPAFSAVCTTRLTKRTLCMYYTLSQGKCAHITQVTSTKMKTSLCVVHVSLVSGPPARSQTDWIVTKMPHTQHVLPLFGCQEFAFTVIGGEPSYRCAAQEDRGLLGNTWNFEKCSPRRPLSIKL